MISVLDTPRSKLSVRQSMITVLHARVVTGAGGGPDKTILRSPRYLRDHGYDELCAYLRPPGDEQFSVLEQRASEAGAELIAIDDRGPLDWRVVSKLIQLCRERNVQVWHGHDYKSNLLGLIVGRYWPLRLVTTVHGWVQHTWKTPLYYLVDRLSLPWYERVICVSPDLQRDCLQSRVPAKRCLLLDNAIEVDVFCRSHSIADAKRRQGRGPDRLLLGAVGRLSAEKGFDLLIRALRKLVDAGHDIDLVILGDGPERARLQALVTQLALDDRVQLLGHSNLVVEWIEAFDLFVLSSLREGLPNVLLEAMALESPVLATDCGGVGRLVRNNENGRLIAPGSEPALVEGIHNLLDSPTDRARLAVAGRRTICERFDFSQRMRQMRRIYDELLGLEP